MNRRNAETSNRPYCVTMSAGVVLLCVSAAARGQSSSLFQEGEQVAAERVAASQPAPGAPVAVNAGTTMPYDMDVNEPLNNASFIAVGPPKPRTFKVHDAVTIIVLERMRYQSDNQFQQDKRWDMQQKLKAWFRLHDNKWLQQNFEGGSPEISLQTNDRRTGNGRSNRQDELTTRITAEIVDVKPNGQLVLAASRKIKFDEEQQTVTLMARCRGQDVSADNSLLSTQLIDMELYTDNDGQVRDAGKRGWLQRLFDKIRPI